MLVSREFMHGKKFDEQWKSLGLIDKNLKELQSILLDNPKTSALMQGTGKLHKMRYSYENRGKLSRHGSPAGTDPMAHPAGCWNCWLVRQYCW